jgi:hypothetical protein
MARKKIKPLSVLIGTLIIIWMFAFVFAAPSLAAWYYGTEAPTREQIRLAKVIIALPCTVSLGIFLLWCWWHQRRDDRAMRRQARFAPTFENPGHELKLDRKSPDVD